MARRVAVIGAGCAGLTCIKCCLDEGMEPVCFESSDDIGGLWRFRHGFSHNCITLLTRYHNDKLNYKSEVLDCHQISSMARRVAVIGAGCAGLTCIKCCLDEGMEPVCFESSDDIGGLWRFRETQESGRTSVYRSLVVNTSKEMMCFSDFPMPAHYPNFMHHSLLLQYLRLYVEHFNLLRHIHFQTTVHSVRQRQDFSQSGQWEVITERSDGQKETHVFDAVLVCSGYFTQPVTSAFPGIDTFPGKCTHSRDYKDAKAFAGKRLLVVGIGNSGGDIAVEISRVAEKTFLSIRNGAWVVSRMAGHGLPLDVMVFRRSSSLMLQLLPRSLLNWLMERELNQKYDHKLYGLQPRHRILDRELLVNDELPGCIIKGALQVKPDIREFCGSTVVFDNGVKEEGIDAVVFCTGYKASFPFLPPTINNDPDGELTLFKRVFPVCLEHPTLAFIGIIRATGPLIPLMEIQGRWATRVFAGRNHLPPLDEMHDIMEKHTRYSCSKSADLELDYMTYVDSVAKEIGVRPNLFWLLLSDPGLGLRVLFGPRTSYQFRLHGPGRWEGARQAIFTQWERISQPLKTRPIPEPKSSGLAHWLSLAGGTVLVFAVIVIQRRNPGFFQNQAAWISSTV